MPAASELNEHVELPVPPADKVTLVGLHDTVMLELETDAERLTAPEKWLRLASVTEKVPVELALNDIEIGLAEILKSTTWIIPEVRCDIPPLVPVAVNV